MGVVIIEGEGAVLGVNLGRPIVTKGAFLRSCVEVRTAIKLAFGVVSGMGPGIDVLDGVHVPQGKGLFGGFFGICVPLV